MRLAVHDHGPDGLPAAVIAHGVGSSPRFVRDAFEAPLAGAGHRLVTYDLRGHGLSTPLPDPAAHDLVAQAADLGAVATAVGARLVGGVSLGAHAAAVWASGDRHIEGLLACLPGWLGALPPGEGPHAAVAAEIRSAGVAGALERLRVDPAVPGWLRRVLVRDWSRCEPSSLAAALVSLDGADGPLHGTLGRIEAPVGLCGWPDDPGHPLAVAQAWADALPRAALVGTTMDAVGADPAALGSSALEALARARATEPGASRRL